LDESVTTDEGAGDAGEGEEVLGLALALAAGGGAVILVVGGQRARERPLIDLPGQGAFTCGGCGI
jgi:hypothetical protein